jgi:hypothetical protein
MRKAPVSMVTASLVSETWKALEGQSSLISNKPLTSLNCASGHIRIRTIWGVQTVKATSTLFPRDVAQWKLMPDATFSKEDILWMASCSSGCLFAGWASAGVPSSKAGAAPAIVRRSLLVTMIFPRVK